ncbi:MAG TPA: carbohydrate ABC transporter permease [Candidatus Limnocylindrales bacterium]|jgi:alpha-glucoside transport system permease protein|nr:carbohydrate ABC transporter permease [Candidatus Limnocylindrales bacterium]
MSLERPTELAAVGPRSAVRGRPPVRWGRLALHAVLVILMIVWLLPTIGMLVNSFRPAADVSRTGWWTALSPTAQFTMENYQHVLAQNGLGQAFINSLFITIPATVIPIAVASFAAYAFAWMRFPGRDVLFIIVVGLLVIPLQTTFVPILRLFRDLGIAGDFLTVWLAHTGYGLPFAIFLLRNYMGGLPREVFESAAIDGASPATAFFRLALPMSVPAIAALVIFQFLFVWNDLLVALIYLGAANAPNLPLTVLVANLSNSLGGEWHYLMAAAFLSMALPLLVFFGLQRYFVRGITGGAVKG